MAEANVIFITLIMINHKIREQILNGARFTVLADTYCILHTI